MGTIAQKGSRLAETKALLKQRLTEKGIDVSDENVFYRLADKVGDIVGGLDTSDATATADDILLGKTAYLAAGKETGKIQTVGEQTIIPGVADRTIGPGVYLSGQQTVKGDANLVSANIKSGVSIFGVGGSYAGEGSIVHAKIPDTSFTKESSYLLRCNLSQASPNIPANFKAAFLCVGFEGPTLTGTGMALYSEEFSVSLSGSFNGMFCTGLDNGLVPFYWSISGEYIEFDTSEAEVIVPKMFYPMNSPYSFFAY